MLALLKFLFITALFFPILFFLQVNQSLAEDCQRNRPKLEVFASNKTGIGKPAELLSYTVKVTNQDVGQNCPTSRVDLSATILNRGGWKYQLEKNTFSDVAPGTAKSTKLYITSPASSMDGPKTITINAKRPNGALISFNTVYNVVGSAISPIPSSVPVSSITPSPSQKLLFLRIGVDGIGTTPGIPVGGNKNPDNIFRQLNIRIFDAETNNLTYTVENFPFTYNAVSQKFETLYDFPDTANISDGRYNIYVDGPRFLRTKYPNTVTISEGKITNLTSANFYLITGNINNTDLSENIIDLMDYNVLLSCSIYSQDLTACEEDPNYKDYSDLNDD